MTPVGASGTMRDAVISSIAARMAEDDNLFFLSADLGAPALDRLRARFPDRFINVGIAEQNLVATACGIALEGGRVFAYGLAPFVSMRAFEQIRNNLSLFGQLRPLNVNLLALGAGFSYDVSGPTHHCIEDLSVIRTLPGIDLFSPCDCVSAAALVEHVLAKSSPSYIRLDGKIVPSVYQEARLPALHLGFSELVKGKDTCIVSTGYPVHECLAIAHELNREGDSVGLVDIFSFRPLDEDALFEVLGGYGRIVSVAESFIGRGGLDTLLLSGLNKREMRILVAPIGIDDTYIFQNGDRRRLHDIAKMSKAHIIAAINH